MVQMEAVAEMVSLVEARIAKLELLATQDIGAMKIANAKLALAMCVEME